ncbi:hypothetical protein ACP70R_019693 [Stipagrostis hirtigluma subsp. patula]
MEREVATEGWQRRRREHRNGGGRFRAEIEMDRGASIPRGPEFGFAAAVREPLVKLQRPIFDFERWDWEYFAWPHDRLDANLEMRDSDPTATLEADKKASESFINRSTLELESCSMDWQRQAQHKEHDNEATRLLKPLLADNKPTGFSSHIQASGCRPRSAVSVEHDRSNGEMRKSDPETAEEADMVSSESLLSWSTTQEQQKEEDELRTSWLVDGKPLHVRRKRRSEAPGARGATRRRRGCAEANGFLDHGRALQGPWAC